MADRLRPAAVPVRPARPAAAARRRRSTGGVVDLSIGTPMRSRRRRRWSPRCRRRAASAATRRASAPPRCARRSPAGSTRRFDVDVPTPPTSPRASAPRSSSAPLPQWLRLRTPDRDTVLYPAVAYPTYEMGAILAGCRPVPVPLTPTRSARPRGDRRRRRRPGAVLWVNSPANPTGALDDLGAAAAWGRAHDVPVFTDECYVEFTWDGRGRTILEHGLDGVVAVHSLSKRSNLAGGRGRLLRRRPRAGATTCSEVRKHVGMMVPGPAQAAGVVALADDDHVGVQRDRYRRRLERAGRGRSAPGRASTIALPDRRLLPVVRRRRRLGVRRAPGRDGGALVSPGEFYGPGCAPNVRVAVVQPDDRIELMAARLRAGGA